MHGATLTELTDEFDLSKTGVLKHVRTLCESGHLVRQGNTYEVGLRLLPLAAEARRRFQLTSLAEPEVTKLAQAAGEQANVLVEENGRGVYLITVNAREGEDLTPIEGTIVSLDETGAGKAILSRFSDERVRELYEAERLQIDSPEAFADLEDELRTIRDQEVAFDRGNNRFERQCIGTAIVGTDDELAGAIELAGPEVRVTDKRLEEDFPGLILGSASDVEAKLRAD